MNAVDVITLEALLMRRWDDLAADAYGGFLEHDRGALLVDPGDDSQPGRYWSAGDAVSLPIDAALRETLMKQVDQYDPEATFVVMTCSRVADGYRLVVFTVGSGYYGRKTPVECWRARYGIPAPRYVM